MKAKIKDEWVAALRSGRFQQCGGLLKMETAHGCFHCALGVLMELAVEHGIIEDYEETADIPDEVAEWAGLTGAEIKATVYNNDILGYPFDELAGYIEAKL